ncbi:MAG: 6,7-dimethyl-8-ribityllumazine synthase [Saprospirales bacterium]|nr:6,7-dimethyl-8-ribityllumazine synthase [Saprospirales bacterium]MBK8492328.1 6,7-dimethyl-8-ribityllumazine synthase [Saprospirales bacterium]
MSSALKNLSSYDPATVPHAEAMHFGIVVSEWHPEITHALYEGCFQTLLEHGAKEDHIHTAQVPGAFELPLGAQLLASNKKVDAVICLGCVIKGETPHNDYINRSVASALSQLSLVSSKPFVFGLLTPDSLEQAQDRAGGQHGNKGIEAAVTAIRMAALKQEISSPKKKIGF